MLARKPNAERGLSGITKIINQIDTEINLHGQAIAKEYDRRMNISTKFDKLELKLVNFVDRIVDTVDTWLDARREKLSAEIEASYAKQDALVADKARLELVQAKV